VGDLVDGLEAGFQTFSVHDPSSSEYRRAVARLSRAFASLWEQQSEVSLEVGPDRFALFGDPVGGAAAGGSRLVECLRTGGIQSLTFSPGAEGSEVVRFLNTMQLGPAIISTEDDGLRSLLWGLDLEHIRYSVAEEPAGTAPEPKATRSDGPQESAERRARIRDEASSAPTSAVVDVADFDSTLYFLDQREIDYLKDEIDQEYAQDLGRSIVSLLLDVLDVQTDPEVRAEVTSVFERLLPQLLADGAFGSATHLLAETEALMRGPGVTAADRKALGRMTAQLSRPGALAQLLQFLEEGQSLPSSDELGALFGRLRPEALETILKWMRNLSNVDAAALLSEAVEQMAREHPTAVRAALRSKDPVVLDRALDLVLKIRSAEVVEELCDVGSHPDSGVRTTAAQALGAIGGARCCGELTRMIDDPEASVRVSALRALTTRRYPRALDRIDEILREDALLSLELVEQRALFEAYGSLAGSAGIAYLEPLLLGKKGVGRISPEVRACAAVALGRIGTPAARMALRNAEKDKNPVVRSAAGKALLEEGQD
jgi:HEAT repeat protein